MRRINRYTVEDFQMLCKAAYRILIQHASTCNLPAICTCVELDSSGRRFRNAFESVNFSQFHCRFRPVSSDHSMRSALWLKAAGRCKFDQYVIRETTILLRLCLLVAPKPSDTPKILHIDVVAMCSGATQHGWLPHPAQRMGGTIRKEIGEVESKYRNHSMFEATPWSLWCPSIWSSVEPYRGGGL